MNDSVRYSEYYLMQPIFDNLYAKSKENFSFSNLYELIISRDNLLLAYRNIKSNTGSKTVGTDGLSIKDYKIMDEDTFISNIRERLANFHPNSVRRVFIPKANGKERPLGIPTMEDRLIQQSIKQILEPICEAKFFEHSYGFRPNRSTHHALARMLNLINVGKNHYVVDIDIEGFFDNVNHNKLIKQLFSLGIKDKRLLAIIKKMLKANIKGEGIPNKGVPQGGILSPILSNVVLNELDHWVSDQFETFDISKLGSKDTRKYRFLQTKTNMKQGFIVRYADDFKIITTSYNEAKRWYFAVQNFLEKRLGLNISKEKSKITNLRKRKSEFLGFKIKGVRKGKRIVAHSFISDKKKQDIIQSLRERARTLYRSNTRKEAYEYNSYIRGIHNYFSAASHVSVDMKEIAYKTYRTIWNNLSKISESGKCEVKGYERYNYTTFSINEVPLIPVSAVKSIVVKQFQQDINDYSLKGRELNSKVNLMHNVQKAVQQLAKTYIEKRSIQYNDNRVSKFSASKGKCFVTDVDLTRDIHNYHCHHITPIYLGGTDEYENLAVLHKFAHILVHATKEETIEKYMRLLNINEYQLKKLNKLRKACKLQPIKD